MMISFRIRHVAMAVAAASCLFGTAANARVLGSYDFVYARVSSLNASAVWSASWGIAWDACRGFVSLNTRSIKMVSFKAGQTFATPTPPGQFDVVSKWTCYDTTNTQ
jgi:hypothetical protein